MNKERNNRECRSDYYSTNTDIDTSFNERRVDRRSERRSEERLQDTNQNIIAFNNSEENDCCSKAPHKPDGNSCCCKKHIRRAIELLLDPSIRNIINLTSFTLIGQGFNTTNGATTLKSVSSCSDGLVTYTDANPIFTATTLCDIGAITFSLIEDDTEIDCDITNRERFIRYIQRNVKTVDPKQFCCGPEDDCCCNASKAQFLASSIGPINIRVNSSTFSTPLVGFTVIAVTKNIAWLINSSNRVLIVCLDQIVQLG